jgi:hypothetical protein
MTQATQTENLLSLILFITSTYHIVIIFVLQSHGREVYAVTKDFIIIEIFAA